MKTVRQPAVAGTFYEASPVALRRQIEGCFRHPLGPRSVPHVAPSPVAGAGAYVVPHAGYIYSGPVAAWAFSALAQRGIPSVVVILGPNHYGVGEALALSSHEHWETPLGTVKLATALGQRLAERLPALKHSEDAHRLEHSIEVQLPFLQFLYGSSLQLLPIALADQSLETSLALGASLAQDLPASGAVLLASSDFSHYVGDEAARRNDRYALEAIQALDPARLAREVQERGITMCGPGAVIAAIECLRRLGAGEAKILAYGTSADTSGDYGRVVGYAAVEILS